METNLNAPKYPRPSFSLAALTLAILDLEERGGLRGDSK